MQTSDRNQRTPRRPSILLLALLALAALVACGANDDARSERPPAREIEIEGDTYPLGLGTNCWRADEGMAALCVDAIGIITSPPYGQAARGSTVTLSGELADEAIPLVSAQL